MKCDRHEQIPKLDVAGSESTGSVNRRAQDRTGIGGRRNVHGKIKAGA
jgi:hypothetical protein